MKYLKHVSMAGGLALLLSSNAAFADIVKDASGTAITTTPSGSTQTVWVGSDTLNKVIATVTASITLNQITTYLDQGSGQGQRQMEGSPTANTSEPACGPSDGNGYPEANPGCQEISPMSRQMDNKICEDDITTLGGGSGLNTTAEALAVCGDGVVVIANNADHTQFADDAASCATGTSDNGSPFVPNATYAKAGKLRHNGTFNLDSGGTYTVSDWKDVLRVVYTGCKNDGGKCDTTSRITRCTDPVRKTLLNHWEYLVESGAVSGDGAVSCGAATCPSLANGDGGVRQAYRRDDGSGTTGVFLQLLGLGAPILQRTGYIKLVPPTTVQIIPIPDLATPPTTTPPTPGGNMFCDGGDTEGFWHAGNGITPVPVTSTTLVTAVDPSGFGDPITRPCLDDANPASSLPDNLCNFTGRIGVVRAIRSPGTGDATFPDFPVKQCSAGRFALKKFVNTNTSLPICPDGTRPSGNQCNLPYFTADNGVTKDFRCVNYKTNRPASLPSWIDGRAYNYVVRDVSGVVKYLDGATQFKPDVAQWRQHMARLDLVPPFSNVDIGADSSRAFVCNDVDATRLMGCLVGNSKCTIGWAGREAAGTSTSDDLQEPFRLHNGQTPGAYVTPGDADILSFNYPFSRDLYLSAIGGFENITADCLARGGSANYCNDELAIANAFYTNGPLVQNACINAGFVARPTASCVGAMDAKGTNGACGAPASQASTACEPH